MSQFEQCPVCQGTGREPYPEGVKVHSSAYGYDPQTHTIPCTNCGGQYMYSAPTGMVPLNKKGLPCVHVYLVERVGNCLYQYKCLECDDTFQIDSGD